MEEALLEIIDAIKAGNVDINAAWLDKLVRRHNRAMHDATRQVAKKRLLPFYLKVKECEPDRWRAWQVDEACEERLVGLLKAKPRRTASGVATVTVITKPHPCSSACIYCPNDIRMPKSYLTDEPACQRAERNYFDPYLQVMSRLRALHAMGHVTDKVELIVLGGTWSDYPQAYQIWFMHELFRAVNDAGEQSLIEPSDQVASRIAFYEHAGLTHDAHELAHLTADAQKRINAKETTYNEEARALYGTGAWADVAEAQHATFEQLEAEQHKNESAKSRVVGLVIETRPDLITVENLIMLRRLGCTKVQMGIQSLNDDILCANQRHLTRARIAQAFALLRLFGFKSHIHFMVNLLGATPEADKTDYALLVSDERFMPDEVKLYPCCLVESARLVECYMQGTWQPYSEEVLVDVLVHDVLQTPEQTRISRMIRDISAGDIIAGSKKTNLRQMVEEAVIATHEPVREIRMREIASNAVEIGALHTKDVVYNTATSEEHFLQWVTDENTIAGFCRLSLPKADAFDVLDELRSSLSGDVSDDVTNDVFPITLQPSAAMIREVHVYGRAARFHQASGSAQHAGLGKQLVAWAAHIARTAGYSSLNVISSVGTRLYYRGLGFEDGGLYQVMDLK